MELVANNLYRGQRPKSFYDLQAKGIKVVINLQSGAHELLNNDTYEHERASNFEMIEYNIKCSDITPPSKKQVKEFLDLVSKHSLDKVYVHCLHGKDRTGFMCASYRRKVLGWGYAQTIKEMFSKGFHKVPYLWWVLFL